jgi:hypothetical protein
MKISWPKMGVDINPKAITPIIAIVLMLLLLVSAAAVTWLFISGTLQRIFGIGTGEGTLVQAGLASIRIESLQGDKVIIRNTGSIALQGFTVFADGVIVAEIERELDPDDILEIEFPPLLQGEDHEVKVVSQYASEALRRIPASLAKGPTYWWNLSWNGRIGLTLIENSSLERKNEVVKIRAGFMRWFPISGNWEVEGLEYSGSGTSGQQHSIAGEASWTDYIIEARVKILDVSNHDAGILFRVQDDSNLYLLAIRSEPTYTGNNQLNLYKRVAGGYTSLAIASSYPDINVNTWYDYKIVIQNEGTGVRIKVYKDGVEYINYLEDPRTFDEGKIGFRIYGTTHAHFDELKVKRLDGSILFYDDFDHYSTNCSEDIRVTTSYNEEIPSQVLEEIYSQGVCSNATIAFLADVEEDQIKRYFIYFSNPIASFPSYSSDLSYEFDHANQIFKLENEIYEMAWWWGDGAESSQGAIGWRNWTSKLTSREQGQSTNYGINLMNIKIWDGENYIFEAQGTRVDIGKEGPIEIRFNFSGELQVATWKFNFTYLASAYSKSPIVEARFYILPNDSLTLRFQWEDFGAPAEVINTSYNYTRYYLPAEVLETGELIGERVYPGETGEQGYEPYCLIPGIGGCVENITLIENWTANYDTKFSEGWAIFFDEVLEQAIRVKAWHGAPGGAYKERVGMQVELNVTWSAFETYIYGPMYWTYLKGAQEEARRLYLRIKNPLQASLGYPYLRTG